MFDQLLQLVKDNAGDAIINNPAIPNEKNDSAIESTTSSIFDSLKNMATQGNLTDMFKDGGSSTAVANITSNAAGGLMEKFGLDSSAASNIAQQLIPSVLDKFVSKTNDPNDSSFDLGSIVSSLTGGSGGGILDSLKGMFGS
jgi:hypothetical protein